ncbi:hypothetical protein BgiBS90_030076, partial [Biomphalaria glabrata]
FLLSLVGYASNFIVSLNGNRDLAHTGIWKECHVPLDQPTQCNNIADFTEWNHWTR